MAMTEKPKGRTTVPLIVVVVLLVIFIPAWMLFKVPSPQFYYDPQFNVVEWSQRPEVAVRLERLHYTADDEPGVISGALDREHAEYILMRLERAEECVANFYLHYGKSRRDMNLWDVIRERVFATACKQRFIPRTG